jgi:HEAT repeat protein
MKLILWLFFLFVSLPFFVAADESQDRLDVIRYGTETEIAALIQSLKTDDSYADDALDAELIALAQKASNKKILAGVLDFFGNRNKRDLEDRALSILENSNNAENGESENEETVLAAINYFGKIQSPKAASALEAVIDANKPNLMGTAIRALGNAADSGNADSIADFLIELYTNRDPGTGNNGRLLTALGETKSKKAIPFLADIAKNAGESAFLRISAIEALAKAGDDDGLDAVLNAVSASEPSIRTAAVAALGAFSGKQVDDAIIENFRDPFFRTRASAAKSAGQRKLTDAIPYLKYRAEKDEARIVREESIRALGAIGTKDALSTLENLFSEPKNPDYVRIMCAETLINSNADAYAEMVIAALDDAQKKHQTSLYNGFLRILSSAKTSKLESLAKRFFASGAALEKSAALDMTLNNKFTAFKEDVRALTDKKNGALAIKAQKVLDQL